MQRDNPMKLLLASTAFAVALFAAPAFAQQPPTEPTAPTEQAQPPQSDKSVVIDTTVTDTPAAKVETTTEVIAPVSDRPALDAEHPIAPEVQAVVDSKKNYTTADIVAAQHQAMLATPVSEPTAVITTTTTIPKSDG